MYYINYLTIGKNDGSAPDVHLISDDTAGKIVDVLNKGGQVAVLEVDEPARDGQKIVSRTINLKNFISLNKVELIGNGENPEKMHEEMANLLVNESQEITKQVKFKDGAGNWAEKSVKERRGNRIVFYADTQDGARKMHDKVYFFLKENHGNSFNSFTNNLFPVPRISFDGAGIEPASITFLVFNPQNYGGKRKTYDYSFFAK